MKKLTKKQQKANRKLWVKALKSKKYKQAQGKLRGRRNERCCLGVLCDLYKSKTGKGKWYKGCFIIDEQNSGDQIPPSTVTNWVGMGTREGRLSGEYTTKQGYPTTSLANLNDHSEGFDQVIEQIEKGNLI